jgi:hypothetical protein
MPGGKYVVFVRGTSIEVELIKAKSGERDSVAIGNFADSCVSITVVLRTGEN